MKKRNRNLLTVTAIAAALLLTGCGSALEGGVASINKSHETLATGAHGTQLSGKTIVKQEVDKEDNTVEYEYIENGNEVEVEVDAATGEVIETETEPVEEVKKEAKTEAKAEVKTITLAEAKAKAIAHAKVDESTLYDVSAELDDGVYEVEFSSKGTEYNYKISKTGEILKNYTEVDDDYVEPTKTETKKITKSKAKSIALNHAGVKADSIRGYEIELDDGVYEISFEKGRTEYEYEIKATTGEILRHSKEKDD